MRFTLFCLGYILMFTGCFVSECPHTDFVMWSEGASWAGLNVRSDCDFLLVLRMGSQTSEESRVLSERSKGFYIQFREHALAVVDADSNEEILNVEVPSGCEHRVAQSLELFKKVVRPTETTFGLGDLACGDQVDEVQLTVRHIVRDD